jgi:pimeloyl-ACP methyl ester carboxylesterase
MPDGSLSAIHFGRMSNPLKLVFCHANGFNAQSYREIIEPLGVHAVALDLRGHGRTELPTDPERLKNWQIFADDIATFFERYVDAPVVLGGHSYGAVSGILSLPKTREKVRGYVGFDPVLVPRAMAMMTHFSFAREYMKLRVPIARKAGERKSVFESVEAAFTRYHGRGAFKGFPDTVLRDYVAGGTRSMLDGRVRLACDPKWEQAIFAAQAHNMFRHIPSLPDASRIIFAGARGRVSTARQRAHLQTLQPNISVEFERDFNHLFPFQEPGFATEALRSVIQAAALAR